MRGQRAGELGGKPRRIREQVSHRGLQYPICLWLVEIFYEHHDHGSSTDQNILSIHSSVRVRFGLFCIVLVPLEKPVPVGLDEGETYRKAILYLAGFMTSIKYDKANGGNRFLQCNLYRSVKKRIEDLNLFSLRFFFLPRSYVPVFQREFSHLALTLLWVHFEVLYLQVRLL